MKKIPIMFCFNNNYVIPASACFISIMEHASNKNEYVFYILHSDITVERQELLKEDLKKYPNCKIIFKNMNNLYEDEYNKIENHSHFSKELLYKLSCASIFTNLKKIIITDVDVIFLDDIGKMYDAFECDEDYYYAGIGPLKKIESSIYRGDLYSKFNEIEIKKLEAGVGAGFLLVNLEKIRSNNYEKKMMDYLVKNSNRLIQIEQDVINICCYKKIKKMPFRFMVCSFEYDYFKNNKISDKLMNDDDVEFVKEGLNNPIQLHYATPIKPWIYTDCTKSEVWFQYFKMSKFCELYYDDIIKNGKSVNSFFVKFMKTRLYHFMLKIYHLLKKIYKIVRRK